MAALAQKWAYASFLLWFRELFSNLPAGLAYVEITGQIQLQ
ncbi:hypothetical protein CRENPOLYSF2_1410008 [Crenothrix polyspora]|uniref:Uncharacterized protein n=1 Tax=Crenothrix polyspora TaxID=360316 RepID=A0A1R4H176_9GAMM|nr:hypothetical protein CRENPOLYSF2_1410008 [Crenothrix polyspora]